MEMMEWIDTIIAFLAVSSALLLVLGILSYMMMRLLKIRGKPNLWICTMLMLIPLIYPIHTFLPDTARIPIPILSATSPIPKPVATGTTETTLPGAGILQSLSPATPSGVSAEATGSDAGNASIHPAPWKLLIASAWILPLLFFLFRSALMVFRTRRLSRNAEPMNDPAVLELLRRCAAETGVRKVPELKRTEPLSTPMLMGFLRPIILLPEHLLTVSFQEGLRFTLLHELKHLKRRDNWWLLVESVVGAVYFFHPVIYWAKKRIHEEWEYLCDHHVIRITRKSASYADFLLHEVWNHGRGAPHPATAVPFIATGVSKTARRVRSILENNTPTFFTKLRGRLAVGMVFVSFLSMLTFTASPSIREETATTASIETRLTALPGETAPAPAAIETAAVAMRPNTDEAAPVPTLSTSTPARVSSTASPPKAEETRPAASTTPVYSDMLAAGAATPNEELKSSASATSPAPAASVAQDAAARQKQAIAPAAAITLAENDAPQPEKQAHAVKTEPATDATADKYSILDNQLEQVSDIPSFHMMNWDWETIDNRSFILHTSPGRYYLILLQRPAPGLMLTESISISNIGAKIKPGDWVEVFEPPRSVSIIHKIFKLENRKAVSQIRNQLS